MPILKKTMFGRRRFLVNSLYFITQFILSLKPLILFGKGSVIFNKVSTDFCIENIDFVFFNLSKKNTHRPKNVFYREKGKFLSFFLCGDFFSVSYRSATKGKYM